MEKRFLILLMSIALFSCASQKSVIKSERIQTGEYNITVEQMFFESREIDKGSIEPGTDGAVTILLPGSYDTSGKD